MFIIQRGRNYSGGQNKGGRINRLLYLLRITGDQLLSLVKYPQRIIRNILSRKNLQGAFAKGAKSLCKPNLKARPSP